MASMHVVVVSHANGRARTEVSGYSLATWTRKPSRKSQGEGVTVRYDQRPASDTLRFDNAEVVAGYEIPSLF